MASIAPATPDEQRTNGDSARIRTYGSPWLSLYQSFRRRNRLKTLRKDRKKRDQQRH